MEKLYEVTLCKINSMTHHACGYIPINETKICIMDGEKFIDIEDNKEYECLKNTDLDYAHNEALKKCKYVIEIKPYTKESLSENEVSLNYLRALRTRRILNNRQEAKLQKSGTYQKR